LNNDVLDKEFVNIHALSIRVRFGIFEETEEVFDGLLGPATCERAKLERVLNLQTEVRRTLNCLELLSLAGTSNTTIETTERNALLVLLDVTKVGVSLGKLHAYVTH